MRSEPRTRSRPLSLASIPASSRFARVSQVARITRSRQRQPIRWVCRICPRCDRVRSAVCSSVASSFDHCGVRMAPRSHRDDASQPRPPRDLPWMLLRMLPRMRRCAFCRTCSAGAASGAVGGIATSGCRTSGRSMQSESRAREQRHPSGVLDNFHALPTATGHRSQRPHAGHAK